ncbi:MAG: hypothetical protein JXR84_10260 [Anaerolineae bacterium]|nr:hypothetical protein [Anaerolineae bacterium]
MKLSLSWIWIALLSLVGSLHTPSFQIAVGLIDFYAEAGTGTITVYWETASETDNLGFRLWRSQELNGSYVDVSGFIASLDEGAGAFYEFEDTDVILGVTYYYKLQDIPADGSSSSFTDPISVTIPLPVIATPTQIPTRTPTPPGVNCVAAARLRSTSYTAPITINLPQAPAAAEVEPNDEFTDANTFVIPGFMTGAISPFGDEDYFRIATTSAQVYTISLTRTDIQERRIDVYTNAYIWVTSAETNPADPTVSLSFLAQTTLYYIRVSAPYNDSTAGPTDYRIDIGPPTAPPTNTPTPTSTPTSTPTPTATPWPTPFPWPPDVHFESEPNDITETANSLPVPGKIVGAITNLYDADCFSIDVASTLIGAQYRLSLRDYGLTR